MSINSKQKTLFESWNSACSKNLSSNCTNLPSFQPKSNLNISTSSNDSFQESRPNLCGDVDDIELLSATVALEHSKPDLFSQSLEPSNKDLDGFDKFSGGIWVYPTNYPIREYQFSIAKNSLFENTLVALPTGLGKTFIAAVVLYNYYRWYPQGKVVFMAPTKPLVSQQIEACYKIMGIPMEDQAQLTGATMASHQRSHLWSSKRVFFVTPQVINNDLAKGVCPALAIKCIVVDEAHKALGNHAYCQVIQQLLCHNRNFRVLALSATPGSDLKTVQQVIKNLLISKIEIRAEDSIDIKQYVHTRSVDKVVVKLTEQILNLREKYFNVIQMFITCLVNNKALYHKDVRYLTKYALLMARDQFRKDPPSGLSRSLIGTLEGAFAISISLYHGLELLLQHGMKSFFIFLKGIMDGPKSNVRSKTMLYGNEDFRSLYDKLIEYYGANPESVVLCTQAGGSQLASKSPFTQKDSDSYLYSHPKIKKLEEVVLNHFQSMAGDAEHDTRVMIFCQYRDIVREITELLQRHRPLVRPMQFVGHAPSTNPNDDEKPSGKANRRFTQKDQLMVVSKFRNGDYNTLVSTCVGEEGLDIGDVDLIVCYDSHKSPIRLVQRMGRTGRKRKGKIVMLVTEGKEERDYNSSLASRKSIHKAILGAGKTLQYYPHSPPMIPAGFKPKCHKMFISVPEKAAPDQPAKKSKSKPQTSSTVNVAAMLKKNVKSHGLDAQQKEVWKKNFMLSSEEEKHLKTLPPKNQTGKCVYLEKELQDSIYDKPNSKYLSLTEWLPWQSRLQFSKFVGHSSKSKMLTEVLQFCDDVRMNGATQHGYRHDHVNPAHNDVRTSKNNKLLNGKKLQKEKNVKHSAVPSKKKRKPLIVVSDDEDFQPDDFQDFPVFDLKDRFVPRKPGSVSRDIANEGDSKIEKKSNLASDNRPVDAEISPEKFRSSATFVASTSIRDNFLKDNCEKSKDSNSFLFSNLSALSPSPTNSDESYTDCKSMKISKSAVEICISRPRDPSCVNGISLEFLQDDVSCSNNSQGKTPTCFKIWESDDDDNHEQASYDRLGQDSNINDPVTDPTFPASESNFGQVTDQSLFINQKDKEETKVVPIKNFTEQIVRDSSHEHASNSHQVESNPGHKVSFDGSADMFAPQFELDFDLDFDECDPIPEDKTPLPNFKSPRPDISKSLEKVQPDSLTIKAVDHFPTTPDKEENRKIASFKTSSQLQTLSPASIFSFNLSQNKRIKNRKLFAELNASGSRTPPCAKVIPQTHATMAERSCFVIEGSPLQPRDCKTSLNTKPRLLKNLKRLKQSRERIVTDDWNDDDDAIFQFMNSPIQKKKKGIIEKQIFESSPILHGKVDLLCDDADEEIDNEPNMEIPFQRVDSIANKRCMSPDSDRSSSAKLSSHPRMKLDVKQSTPKPDSLSSCSYSDESVIVRRKTKTKDKTKRNVNHVIRRNIFICDEAEVNADCEALSSDEDDNNENLDQDLLDFVNDASQLTQSASEGEAPDERALYLRSLHNGNASCRADTVALGGKFKLAYGVGKDVDVFSQVPEPDVSDYVNDSFCVDSNEVSAATDLDDVTLLESQCFSPSDVGPRTRTKKQLEKHLSIPVYNKPHKRIAVFEEDDDLDATQLSTSRPGTSASTKFCSNSLQREQPRDRSSTSDKNPSVRRCEMCEAILVTKGWLCKDCVVIMKRSEMDQKLLSDARCLSSAKKMESHLLLHEEKKKVREAGPQSVVLSLSRKERIKRSKQKQEELRAKLNIKRKSLDSNESSNSSSNVSPGNSLVTSLCRKQKFESKLSSDSLPRHDVRNVESSTCSQNVFKKVLNSKIVEKPTILIDNKEVSSGATSIAQLLRTTHKAEVHVVSLQCCSYLVSRRCAVWRKTVDDVSNATKRQKLALLVKQARAYYEKLFVIVEKNKVKKGWINVKPVQVTNLTAAYLTLTHAGLNVLHSDDQKGTAKLLYMLAVRESTSGFIIPQSVSRHVTNQRLQPLLNVYLSIPGIAYIHALYLCHHFKSLKELLKSSVDKLVSEVKLPSNAAENVFIFMRKKFDIQMTPL